MKQNKNTSTKGTAKQIALGAFAAILIYLALLALVSLLIVRGTVGETRVGVYTCIFAFMAAFAGAKLASHAAAGAAMSCAVSAAAFWLLVQLTGFLTNDALDVTRSATLLIPVALGALAACLTCGGKSKKGKKKRPNRK